MKQYGFYQGKNIFHDYIETASMPLWCGIQRSLKILKTLHGLFLLLCFFAGGIIKA